MQIINDTPAQNREYEIAKKENRAVILYYDIFFGFSLFCHFFEPIGGLF
jgi:hypothetical protein